MRKTSFSTVCVLALLVAGCQNSDDDNRGLEYDTLRVNFKGSMTNGTWETAPRSAFSPPAHATTHRIRR